MRNTSKKENYEEEYQKHFHKNLLSNRKYYLFRAKIGDLDYWKYLNKGITLDYGCGIGQFIFLHRNSAIGLEKSRFAAHECNKRGIKIIPEKKLKESSLSNIVCIHMLEHTKNPKKYIKLFYKFLKPGGKLLLVLPYPFKRCEIKKGDSCDEYIGWKLKGKYGNSYMRNILKKNRFKIIKEKFNYYGGFRAIFFLPIFIAYPLEKIVNFLRNSKEYVYLAIK